MYKTALTAVEQSTANDSMTWCEATEENILDLRRWAENAARREPHGFGETHHHDRWIFRGTDAYGDWCVAVEIEPPQDGEDD